MDDDYIIISNLNDFIFCPASIYFHNLYGSMDTMMYQNSSQINGSHAHKTIDQGTYSSSKSVITRIIL
jgi:CRISPR-associated protein Cas4